MKVLIVSFFLVSSAFASEREGLNACDSYTQQAEKIQKEMTKLSYEIARFHSGPEESSVHSSSSASHNCEEDGPSDHSILVSRRNNLEARLKEVRKEMNRACPRVYPE